MGRYTTGTSPSIIPARLIPWCLVGQEASTRRTSYIRPWKMEYDFIFHLQLQAAAMFPYIVVLEGLPMETTVQGVIVSKSTLDSRSETVATGMWNTKTTETSTILMSAQGNRNLMAIIGMLIILMIWKKISNRRESRQLCSWTNW